MRELEVGLLQEQPKSVESLGPSPCSQSRFFLRARLLVALWINHRYFFKQEFTTAENHVGRALR